ncbi:aldehyde ferredoxin oxidoreductase family protein [Vulcanisaeta souniana]|uniref:Aldehyde ferredoxin oxidoreductase n=1 Tax=Vulcanisaeta souniana JCM 11219 TaxID=1293586 RepID=A0A830EA79_9CREN|nr:aldehyde ferredoxin oxidoreductase family protein [Vulcanisaeta souniana]BDR90945.1 aldehyde ferredoxin oxidoreductase [Vulcanisaeta souniana JCM 11219]GGI79531.1 aldehyde ferredoxin oxidoreductase [Vulcanisaeta souniana JCM 11219]
MFGWGGRVLRIDLSKRRFIVQSLDPSLAQNYIGGRGFAAKTLWDELPPGVDPLSPLNKLILAVGPLTALPIPNSGKLLVASKSPLTGGYGDGNIGTWLAVHMRRAGIDMMIIEGKAEKPTYLYIENKGDEFRVDFNNAEDLWGLDTFTTEDKLKTMHGSDVGMVLIGPAGERLVRFATIVAQKGRSGGRPGMGAVMGSKNLKAIIMRGQGDVKVADPMLRKMGVDAIVATKSKPNYPFWMRQGTTSTVEWAQEASVLPTYNYTEGQFDDYEKIGGFSVEKNKVMTRSCPQCVMACGHVVKDTENEPAELDYENIAMLGSNLGIGDLAKVAHLNRIADMMGMDTISLGSTLGFAMEASERGLLKEGIEWGDYKRAVEVATDIALQRTELGKLLGKGVRAASMVLGPEATEFAMHVKGLEISAYDCHAAPGMALAFSTSPIGAHHKDAWLISWEVQRGRFDYTREKAEKLVEMQNIRGGLFETIVTCRFPWVEVGLELDWYFRLFRAATGMDMNMETLSTISNRIYTLIRAFWVREYGHWDRAYDTPPQKWFKRPLSRGPLRGAKLDYDGYQRLLNWYYELRGWDERGIPRKETLIRLGLNFVIPQLGSKVNLN